MKCFTLQQPKFDPCSEIHEGEKMGKWYFSGSLSPSDPVLTAFPQNCDEKWSWVHSSTQGTATLAKTNHWLWQNMSRASGENCFSVEPDIFWHRTGLGPPYRVENSTGLHILGPQVHIVCFSLWCKWFWSNFISTLLLGSHSSGGTRVGSGVQVRVKLKATKRKTRTTITQHQRSFTRQGHQKRSNDVFSGIALEEQALPGGKRKVLCPSAPPWSRAGRWAWALLTPFN